MGVCVGGCGWVWVGGCMCDGCVCMCACMRAYISNTYITGLLIYMTLAIYNMSYMTPYSCFRTEISKMKKEKNRFVDRN